MFFMKLVMQLIDLLCSLLQRLPPARRNRINPPLTSSDILSRRLQKSRTLQTVQPRIKRSWSYAIAVMLQLLHHREPKNRLIRSMRQNMDAFETKKWFSLIARHELVIPPQH